jgi:hypothetical protein
MLKVSPFLLHSGKEHIEGTTAGNIDVGRYLLGWVDGVLLQQFGW